MYTEQCRAKYHSLDLTGRGLLVKSAGTQLGYADRGYASDLSALPWQLSRRCRDCPEVSLNECGATGTVKATATFGALNCVIETKGLSKLREGMEEWTEGRR